MVWYSVVDGLVVDVDSVFDVIGNILFISHLFFNWGFILIRSVALRCLLGISLSLNLSLNLGLNLSLLIVDFHGGWLFIVPVVDFLDIIVILRSCLFSNLLLFDNFVVVGLWSIFIGFDLLLLFFLGVLTLGFHLTVLLFSLGFDLTVFFFGLEFNCCFRVLADTVLFGFLEVFNDFSD